MTFFRIGCIVLLLTACFHTIGHFQETVPENETEKQLLELMTSYKMQIGNETITMMGLQKGFSLLFTLFLIWPGVLGLYLSKNISTVVLKKVTLIYIGAMAIETAISQIYFFIVPTTCVAIATILFVVAAFKIKS